MIPGPSFAVRSGFRPPKAQRTRLVVQRDRPMVLEAITAAATVVLAVVAVVGLRRERRR